MGNSDDPAGMSGFKPGLLIKAYYPSYRWKFIRRGSPKTPKTHLYGSILSRGRKKNKEKGKVRFASCSDRPDMPSNRTDGTGCVPETAEKSSGSVPVNRLLSERDACRKPLKERDACRKPLKERDACRKPLKERDACRKPLKERDACRKPLKERDACRKPLKERDACRKPLKERDACRKPLKERDACRKPLKERDACRKPLKERDACRKPLKERDACRKPLKERDACRKPLKERDACRKPLKERDACRKPLKERDACRKPLKERDACRKPLKERDACRKPLKERDACRKPLKERDACRKPLKERDACRKPLKERDACRKPLKERDACRKPLKERDACRKPLKERDACRKPLKERDACRKPLKERDACRKPLKERDACRKPLKERDACRKPLKERDACRKPLKELSNEFQVPGGEDVYEFPDDPKDSPTSGICKVNYKNKKLQGGKDPKSEKPRNTVWRTATNMCKISVKKTSRPSQKYILSCGAQKRPNYCNESYSENNLFDISDDDDGDDAVFRVSQLYGSSIIHVGCSSEKKKKVHSKRKKRTSLNSLINKASQTHLKKVKMGVFKAGEERKFFRSKGKISVSNESKVNPITFTNEKDNLCKELHNTHEEITIQGEICISDDNSETTDYLNRSLDTRDRFSYAKSTLDTDTRMSVYDFYDFADSDPHPVHQEAQCSLKKKTRKVKGDTGPAGISLEENDDIKHDRNNAANVKPEDKDRLGENNDSLMVTSKARPYVAEHGPREYLYFNLEGQETEPGAEQISWPQNIVDEVMTSDTDSCTDIDSTGLLCPSDDEPCTPGPLFFDTKWAVSHGVRMLQHLAATADATINKDFKSSCETELSSMSETSGAEQLDQDVPCRSLESFEEQVTQGRPHNENHGLKAGAEIFKTGQSVEPQFQEKTGRLPKQGSPTVNSEAVDQTAISDQGIQVGQPYQLKLSFKNTEYPKNGPKTQAAKPSSGILCEMFQEPSATERDGVLCSYRRMITSGTGQRSTCIDSLFQNDDIFL